MVVVGLVIWVVALALPGYDLGLLLFSGTIVAWASFGLLTEQTAPRRIMRLMAPGTLVGRWRLLSHVARDGGGSVRQHFGERPEGTLLYTPGGWMAAQLAAEDRPPLGTEDPLAAPDASLLTAYSTYLAYSGPYEVRDGVVLHRLTICSVPDWVGTVLTRYFELTADELVLRTPPLELGGRQDVHELRWIREEGWE